MRYKGLIRSIRDSVNVTNNKSLIRIIVDNINVTKKSNNMKTFKIEIKEVLARLVDVEANSLEEALEIVTNSYQNAELVLDADDFLDYEINNFEE